MDQLISWKKLEKKVARYYRPEFRMTDVQKQEKLSMIDVVIPLYNKESHIEKCLKSVLQQTELPRNLIVIDDGSTDNSLCIAKSILAHYTSHYTIETQTNRGVSSARNLGISFSQSSYICFLDADDEWDKNFIKTAKAIIKRLDDPKLGILSFAHSNCIGRKKEIPHQGLPLHYSGYVKNYPLTATKGHIVKTSKAVVSREILQSIGGFPTESGLTEDLYVWFKIYKNSRIYFHGEVLVNANKDADDNRKGRLQETPYIIDYYSGRSDNLNIYDRLYLRAIYIKQALFKILNDHHNSSSDRIYNGKNLFPITSRALYLFQFLYRKFR